MTATRTAIITGASRGLGLALARQLVADGWRVVVDARTATDLSAAFARFDQARAVAVAGDVASEEHRLALRRVVADIGGVDAVRLTQLLLPHLRPGGRIVFVTSDASVEAYEGWGGYGSSKAALDHIAAVLAVERPEFSAGPSP